MPETNTRNEKEAMLRMKKWADYFDLFMKTFTAVYVFLFVSAVTNALLYPIIGFDRYSFAVCCIIVALVVPAGLVVWKSVDEGE